MNIRTFRTLRTRSAVAVLALTTCAGAMVAAAGNAAALSSADLSLTQTVSGSGVSGHTGDTIAIHNNGPDTANTLSVVLLVKTTSNTFSIGINGASCEFVPPAPGFAFMITCQSASLASGSTLNLVADLAGQAGVGFTLRAMVGEHDPGDPTFFNNASSVSTWFGPAANLALNEVTTPTSTPGTAEITATVKSKGPNSASSLQLLVEIKSLSFSGVGATTNQPGASCVFTTPQSGYNVAVSCTLSALAVGSNWTETFDYNGGAGKRLTTYTTISGSPADPAPSNNHHRTLTTYHA